MPQDPAPKFFYKHDGDRLMSIIEALADKFEDLDERVRVLEINQEAREGYSVEDYGVAGDFDEED